MEDSLSRSILAAAGLALLLLLSRSPKRGFPRKPSRSKGTPPVDAEARWKAKLCDHASCTGDRYLIIGVGFLGQRIIDVLLLRGEKNIVAFDIKPCLRYERDPRVTCIVGDVTNSVEVEEACKGVDVVFATFALIRFQDRLKCQAAVSQHINVHGTEHVVAACKASGVKRLIVTSTNMTVVSQQQHSNSMDESMPYINREGALNHYSWTKAVAERHALEAAGPNLDVSVIRICSGMIGPADKILTQKFQDYGFMLMPNPLARIDFVYVDNVVWGHLLAERALVDKRSETSGQVFCITNGEPMTIEEMLTGIQHFKPSLRVDSMPFFLWGVAHVIEWLLWFSGGRLPLGPLEDLTPAALVNASLSYTFSHDKASKTLGYAPLFTMDEAFQLCVAHYGKSFSPPR